MYLDDQFDTVHRKQTCRTNQSRHFILLISWRWQRLQISLTSSDCSRVSQVGCPSVTRASYRYDSAGRLVWVLWQLLVLSDRCWEHITLERCMENLCASCAITNRVTFSLYAAIRKWRYRWSIKIVLIAWCGLFQCLLHLPRFILSTLSQSQCIERTTLHLIKMAVSALLASAKVI
jgi:hypothetical protein